jgi:hypothetical protein
VASGRGRHPAAPARLYDDRRGGIDRAGQNVCLTPTPPETTMTPAPRSRHQRIQDTLRRLEHDVDCWVATADPSTGTPYLVPLSFLWHDDALLLATPAASPTGRNLRASGTARIGIGPTRDVVLVEGTVRVVPDLPAEIGDAFAVKAGFDPRELSSYLFLEVRPQRLQAWREADELTGRVLMRDGTWLD